MHRHKNRHCRHSYRHKQLFLVYIALLVCVDIDIQTVSMHRHRNRHNRHTIDIDYSHLLNRQCLCVDIKLDIVDILIDINSYIECKYYPQLAQTQTYRQCLHIDIEIDTVDIEKTMSTRRHRNRHNSNTSQVTEHLDGYIFPAFYKCALLFLIFS